MDKQTMTNEGALPTASPNILAEHHRETARYAWAQTHIGPHGWQSIKRSLREAARGFLAAGSNGAGDR